MPEHGPDLGQQVERLELLDDAGFAADAEQAELAAALIGGVLFTTGTLIVGVLYDARYSGAGSMLQILAVGLAVYPFQLIRSAFTAVGDTHVVASLSILQAVALLVLMLGGYVVFGSWGAIVGIALQ